MKHVCQPSIRYWPGCPIRFSSGIKVLSTRITWLAVARIPMGSHHDLSTLIDGCERSQASRSCASTLPVLCLAPPGPAVLTRRMAHCAPPALVANALHPSTKYPPSTLVVFVPKLLFSVDARAC